jgi:hypothetical protein
VAARAAQVSYADMHGVDAAGWLAVPLPELRHLELRDQITLWPGLEPIDLPDGERWGRGLRRNAAAL